MPARPGLGLLLAGLAVGLTTTGVVQWLVLSQSLSRDLLMWQTGTLVHAQWDVLAVMAPFWGVGFVLTFALARPLRTLALGDEAAVSLGADPGRVRALATLCVLLLAGTTVAVTGPVSFLGLLVPHAVRGIVGLDERRVLPLAAILGGGALVLADAASRLLRAPRETPVGVLLVAVGALFFLFQLRRGSGARFRLAADA